MRAMAETQRNSNKVICSTRVRANFTMPSSCNSWARVAKWWMINLEAQIAPQKKGLTQASITRQFYSSTATKTLSNARSAPAVDAWLKRWVIETTGACFYSRSSFSTPRLAAAVRAVTTPNQGTWRTKIFKFGMPSVWWTNTTRGRPRRT